MLVRLEQKQDVTLADVPCFRLGALRIVPPLLQVEDADGSRTLEPRVMQVLVMLARHEGQVVSREALLDQCWDGRFVGDNAVHRVMSRLRSLASETGAFTLETIPRVGYRLQEMGDAAAALPASVVPLLREAPMPLDAETPAPATAPAPVPQAFFPRRAALAGLLAAGAAAAVWQWNHTPPSPSQADRLVAKAREALLDGLPAPTDQAVTYLELAVAADPGHSGAWGALALALTSQLELKPDAELPLIASRAQAAAAKAIAIDPGNVEAHVAAATIQPNFRRWQANENALLALESRFGRHQAVDAALGWLLCDVGRWREAVVR